MLTAVLLVALAAPPPPPSPPPPPPSVEDAPPPAPSDAPVEVKIAPKATKARLVEPSYTAPAVFTSLGTFSTIVGLGFLVWGATELGNAFAGLGPALGVAMGCVFLVTGLVLGAIGVFGIILTMAEKREFRLRQLDDTEKSALLPSGVLIARF